MSGIRVVAEGHAVYIGTGGRVPAENERTVLFVHGAGMDHTVWTLPARHFARKGFRVLAVDLPGHGRSDGPPKTSVAALSDWLAAVLDACQLPAACVAGHSMGSLVAWEFARRHPGRLGANANPGVWMLGAGERLLERARPGVFHADLAACNGYQPDAGGVDCPVLVVIGDADQMTPAKAGLAVAAGLPNAQVVRLPGCGHAMLSERPNEVLDALVTAFDT